MKYVQLKGTDLKASAIGFGCASIMGSVGKARSLRALQIADESGINYFDVARSYGYGEAEAVLGQFIRGKRDRLYIATKIGSAPSLKTQMLGKFKPAVRAVLGVAPQMRTFVGKQAMNMTAKGNFAADAVRKSLKTSLKSLGTDYVDLLLLHGCTLEDCLKPELLEFLSQAIDRGSVRYLGIATSMEETLRILESPIRSRFNVVQIKNSIFERNADRISPQSPQTDISIIAHSPFSGASGLGKLRLFLANHPDTLSAWSEALEIPDLGLRQLAALTFQYAFCALEEKGIVLGSMFQEEHIKANAALIQSPVYAKETLIKFAELVQQVSLIDRMSDGDPACLSAKEG